MARRAVNAGIVVLLSLMLGFAALHLVPGDPLTVMIEQLSRSEADRAALRERYGLNASLAEQFVRYLSGVVRGDLGSSLATGRAVAPEVFAAARNSLLLAVAGLSGAAALGLAIGTLHGWFPARRAARWAGTVLTALYAIPEFVLALTLMVVLAYHARLFPIGGFIDPRIAYEPSLGARAASVLHHLALPALTLALGWGAALARLQRQAIHAVAREPFVRTAQAKGAGAYRVVTSHGVRVALPISVTGMGLMLPALFSGAVVVEVLYSWPGLGSLLVQAIAARDYTLASGAMLFIGVVVASATLAADAMRWWLDPRLRVASPS